MRENGAFGAPFFCVRQDTRPKYSKMSPKIRIIPKIFAHSKFLLYLCSVKGKRKGNRVMKAVVYKTEEEHMAALRKMVGLRKVWEAHVRELMANHPEMQVAQ